MADPLHRFHIDQNTGLVIESEVQEDGSLKPLRAHEPDTSQKAFSGWPPKSEYTVLHRLTPWHLLGPAVPGVIALAVALFDLFK